MRTFLETGMRLTCAAALAAAAVGLAAIPLPAAAADVAIAPNATPLPQLAQTYDYGDGYYSYYRPACPDRYYYACRPDPNGNPHCACWPGLGYYLFRYY